MNKKVISSHIFIFPFKWDYINSDRKYKDKIEERIKINNFTSLLDKTYWKKENSNINTDLQYNQYAYFYDNVRQAINGKKDKEGKKVVECWKFIRLDIHSKYIIKLKDNTEYSLNLKEIKLKIYDTGVAHLIYFLDNYDENTTKEDILKINEFGRRIYPQYLPVTDCQGSILAKKLTLKLLHTDELIEEDFIYEAFLKPNKISNTIMKLLGEGFTYSMNDSNLNKVIIKPIIDDRMFVMCNYSNNHVVEDLKNDVIDGKKFWYKYIYIDSEEVTCQDDEMFFDLLKKSTYNRWKNIGTFYGISRYSCVLLKNESAPEYLNNHFKTLYYEMVLLVLTQRASILRFSDEASRIATLDENKALTNSKELQKFYIEFINNIYFREVTAQEQGIEIYDKLLEMMRIERDVKRLDEEINEINKYTSQIVNENTNSLLEVITYITASVAICDTVREIYLKYIDKAEPISWTILAGLTMISVLILLILRWLLKTVSKANSKVKIIILIVYSIIALILLRV